MTDHFRGTKRLVGAGFAVFALMLTMFSAPSVSAEQASSTVRRVAAATVASGGNSTCALTKAGALRCWGDNDSGQLGLGHTDNIGDDEPVTTANSTVRLGAPAIALDAAWAHACAIVKGGQVQCWGRNSEGRLGLGHEDDIGDDELPTATNSTVPLRGAAIAIATGYKHTCAIVKGGKVQCWGRNGDGQLGLGHTNDIGDDEPLKPANSTVPLTRPAIAITAGEYHTCATLKGGAVQCWGDNDDGQLGRGHDDNVGDDEAVTTANSTVRLGKPVVAISAGGYSTCAVLNNGVVRCWGYNADGQLGRGNTNTIGDDELLSPANSTVPLGGKAMAVSVGYSSACAVMVNRKLRCWGDNGDGQLGLGNSDYVGDDEPVTAANSTVPLGSGAVSVSLGEEHACATTSGGTLRCWGYNGDGQLGRGHADDIGDDEMLTATNSTPRIGSPVRIVSATSMSAKVKKARDKKAPYKYALRGVVSGPFVADAASCKGRVKVNTKGKVRLAATRKQGSRMVKARGAATAALRPTAKGCAWSTTLKVRTKKATGKIRAVVSLPGTTNLGAKKSRVRLRLG